MKKLLTILSLFAFMNAAQAAETISEKAKASGNNVKRSVKKKIHEGEEIISCKENDKECLALKAKNRKEEAKDYTKDKIDQGKNIIDNDVE